MLNSFILFDIAFGLKWISIKKISKCHTVFEKQEYDLKQTNIWHCFANNGSTKMKPTKLTSQQNYFLKLPLEITLSSLCQVDLLFTKYEELIIFLVIFAFSSCFSLKFKFWHFEINYPLQNLWRHNV